MNEYVTQETQETPQPAAACDICGLYDLEHQDGRGACECRETFGHLLVNAHQEYKRVMADRTGHAAEILPLTLYTRAGQRLDVQGGLELSASLMTGMACLHDVSVGESDAIDFDQIEIRLIEIAWVGFNVP